MRPRVASWVGVFGPLFWLGASLFTPGTPIIRVPMPIYEYRRPDGSTFEVLQSFSDDALTKDPETGVKVQRVLHAPAVHFKGKGFYNTDYGTRKRQRENAAAADSSSSSNSSSDSGSAKDSAASGDTAVLVKRQGLIFRGQVEGREGLVRQEARAGCGQELRRRGLPSHEPRHRRHGALLLRPSSLLRRRAAWSARSAPARAWVASAATASAANIPSSSGPLMSEMIAGGASQAISGSRKKLDGESNWFFMSVNRACWCSSRWMSVSLGAQRFSRVRASASASLPSR